jgi:hypothetical protein
MDLGQFKPRANAEVAGGPPGMPSWLTVMDDPNGVVRAPRGTRAFLVDGTQAWDNTDGGTTWVPSGSSTEVPYVISLAALRLWSGVAAAVNVLGFASIADGGGGQFYWTTDTISGDDGGTVIVPTAGPRTGCWKRSYCGPVKGAWFGMCSPIDATTAFLAALAMAGSAPVGKRVVRVPFGDYQIRPTGTIHVPDGVLIVGDDWGSVTMTFRMPAPQPALLWGGHTGRTGGGGAVGMMLTCDDGSVTDMVQMTNYGNVRLDGVQIGGATRNQVRGSDVILLIMDGTGLVGGQTCYYADNASVRMNNCYISYADEWGVDADSTFIASSFIESNGRNIAYDTHGSQDPRLGGGCKIRKNLLSLVNVHFENNAGHQILAGTEGITRLSVFGGIFNSGPWVQQPVGGVMTNAAAALYCGDWVRQGYFHALGIGVPRSVVLSAGCQGVKVELLDPSGVGSEEPVFESGDRRVYPGELHFRQGWTGRFVSCGAPGGGVKGKDVGSIALMGPPPGSTNTQLVPEPLYFDDARSKYLHENGTLLNLVGTQLFVDRQIALPYGDTGAAPPGTSGTVNKPMGAVNVASGCTHFILTNSCSVSSRTMCLAIPVSADGTAAVRYTACATNQVDIYLVAPTGNVWVFFYLVDAGP